FSSPLMAQTWFEWRMRGMGFPVMVGLILAVWGALVLTGQGEKAIEALVFVNTPPALATIAGALTVPGVLVLLLLPSLPVLAGAAGTELGGVRFVDQRPPGAASGCHPFLALRPLTDGAFVL